MTPPRRRLGLACAAAVVAVALASCVRDGAEPTTTHATTPRAAAIVVADAASIPHHVDALEPIDAGGYEDILVDVRGTPIVVNFWASWCEPCEREMPLLAAAARAHRDQIQFLGIDILDTPEPARAFLERFDVPYPNLFDAMGGTRDAVGSLGQPVTVFYDADGDVVAKVDGELSADELAKHLDAITS